MSEITLTKKQYDSLPYKTTKISKGKTYGEIIGLLETNGIKDYQWTRLKGVDELAFPLTIDRKGVTQQFLVKMAVPKLMYPISKGRGKYAPKTVTYLEDVSWRIFWWYLKSKLEAIRFGISDEIKEFMYNIHYALPDGSMRSLGDTLIENAEQLTKIGALEDKRLVEANYKVKTH